MSTDPMKNDDSSRQPEEPRTTPQESSATSPVDDHSGDSTAHKTDGTGGASQHEHSEHTAKSDPLPEDKQSPNNSGNAQNQQTAPSAPGYVGLQPGYPAPSPSTPPNPYANPHVVPGYSGYAVPNPAAYPYTAYPANPHDEIVRKRSLMYLLRLCIVGALIAIGIVVTTFNLIGAIIELSDCGTGSYSWSEYSQRICREDNTSAITGSSIFLVIFIAYPICHIFGLLAVRKNQHHVRVLVINIIGIVLSSLGIVLAGLMLLGGIAMITAFGSSGLLAIFIIFLVAGAVPVAELIFSIIFVRHASWMNHKDYFTKPGV